MAQHSRRVWSGRKALLPLVLLATTLLGGCYYAPYPGYPAYAGGYYGGYAAPVVVVGHPYYRGGFYGR